jgi:prepilin-type processing-associated H-X9-DG protein
MALARIKSVEKLRYCSPGEWGKLVGLDRIPEAKTLREKIGILSRQGEPYQWAGELGREWMEMEPEATGVLYVDGHVRVYNGHQTELPRHYVSRQKLCLRATTDYWVNAMDGQPFFVINKEIDPGLPQVLEDEIVPRLEAEIPAQPARFELPRSPHRFTLVFDREGYSPGFMKRMRDKRIACQTYHKYPGEDWQWTIGAFGTG